MLGTEIAAARQGPSWHLYIGEGDGDGVIDGVRELDAVTEGVGEFEGVTVAVKVFEGDAEFVRLGNALIDLTAENDANEEVTGVFDM